MAPRTYNKRELLDTHIRIAPEVYEGIRDRAEFEGRSINAIIERVLASAVRRWNSSKEGKK